MWRGVVLCCLIFGSVRTSEKNYINFGGFICPKEEGALGKCLRDALNTYIPQLASGIPKLGIPPCEPLIVKTLSVKQTAGPISITSSYSDVSVRGPSTMRIKNIEVNSKKQEIIADLHIPELKLKGHYTLKGTLLLLPVEGDGDFTSKYRDVNATVTISLGRNKTLDAADTLMCKDLGVKFKIGHVSMNLDNLFGGDNELGTAMNKFFNENWEQLSEALQEPLEEALKGFLKPLADNAFGTLKADDILGEEIFVI